MNQYRLAVFTAIFAIAVGAFVYADSATAHPKRYPPTATCRQHGDRCMRAVVRPFKPWLRGLRGCESHNTNVNGYFDGYYQFSPSTWSRVDAGYAYQWPLLRQSYGAVRWLRIIGWANRGTSAGWPNCSPW